MYWGVEASRGKDSVGEGILSASVKAFLGALV